MGDSRYSEHLLRAVPLKHLVAGKHHLKILNACLLHRYGNLPTKARVGKMTFYLTGDSASGWHVSINDQRNGYQEYEVTEVGGAYTVVGGGLSVKVSKFSMGTLEKLDE